MLINIKDHEVFKDNHKKSIAKINIAKPIEMKFISTQH